MFVRRLIDLSTSTKELDHHIYLNRDGRDDIRWWIDFMPSLRRRSIIPDSTRIFNSDLLLYSDASFVGCGAIYKHSWIQHAWVLSEVGMSIDFYELFSVYGAVITWGSQWEGKRIVVLTDNEPITFIWKTGTSSVRNMMILVRARFLFAAEHDFSIGFKHISGCVYTFIKTMIYGHSFNDDSSSLKL